MKLWVDIHAPNVLFTKTNWNGLVIPAVGDLVIYGRENNSWVFKVLERSISIGQDPMDDMSPVTHVILKVDSDPTEGFEP